MALQLTADAAALLFENGQTTERTIDDARRLATSLGFGADVLLCWGELIVRLTGDAAAQERVIAAAPTGVDMGKVAATLDVIDKLTRGNMDAAAAESALRAVTQRRSCLRHPLRGVRGGGRGGVGSYIRCDSRVRGRRDSPERGWGRVLAPLVGS